MKWSIKKAQFLNLTTEELDFFILELLCVINTYFPGATPVGAELNSLNFIHAVL